MSTPLAQLLQLFQAYDGALRRCRPARPPPALTQGCTRCNTQPPPSTAAMTGGTGARHSLQLQRQQGSKAARCCRCSATPCWRCEARAPQHHTRMRQMQHTRRRGGVPRAVAHSNLRVSRVAC